MIIKQTTNYTIARWIAITSTNIYLYSIKLLAFIDIHLITCNTNVIWHNHVNITMCSIVVQLQHTYVSPLYNRTIQFNSWIASQFPRRPRVDQYFYWRLPFTDSPQLYVQTAYNIYQNQRFLTKCRPGCFTTLRQLRHSDF